MTLVRTPAIPILVLLTALGGSRVAAAQEPAPEAPVATPPSPPAETGVAVAPAPAPAPAPDPAPAPAPPVAAGTGTPAAPNAMDWGGRQVEPLPPAPPPADPGRINRDPWRGRFWLAPRLTVSGPIDGDTPARPTLLTIGAGADVGIRLSNRIGLGMGISGQIHTSVRQTIPGTTDKRIENGGALFWDALFVRVYLMKRRFQPLLELGGGMVRIAHPVEGVLRGAQVRAGAGFDVWVSGQVTLGFTTVYRLLTARVPADGLAPPYWSVGHAMQGALQIGLHW